MSGNEMAFLVGDNPFLGISHLSQSRARSRGSLLGDPEYCANLVAISVANGAKGFMFSVSDKSLLILEELHKKGLTKDIELYPIVPYAFEYVRLAAQTGGLGGLVKKFAGEMVFSGNLLGAMMGLKGILRNDVTHFLKAYLSYEISRIKSSAGKKVKLESILLHQVVTDLALAFDMKPLFRSYIDFISDLGLTPGFNTGNFPYLVKKLREWQANLREVMIAAPFNKAGFQMNPSKEECEKILTELPEPIVVAISILAAGYLKPYEAIDYIANLPNIRGIVIGVSKEKHAHETFGLLKKKFSPKQITKNIE